MSDGWESPNDLNLDGQRGRGLTPVTTEPVNDDERAWMEQARAATNPSRALAALDHVLEINPDNAEARRMRLDLQVGSLRETVEPTVLKYHEPFSERWGKWLAIGIGLVLLLALLFLALGPIQSWFQDRSTAADVPAPTFAAQVYPSTWTPEPTATDLPVITLVTKPVNEGILGRIQGNIPARAGPDANSRIVGFFQGEVIIQLLARSADGVFIQVKPGNYDNRVWVQASEVQVLNGQPASLPVANQ